MSIWGDKIGHLNFFHVDKIQIGNAVLIKHLNIFRGRFNLVLDNNTYINHANKVSVPVKTIEKEIVFHMKEYSHLTVNHLIDMSDSVVIGKGSWIAGCETQIWTHSFYLAKNEYKSRKVTAPVTIGDHVYIGSRCCILPGVIVGDAITVGAQTCISKDIKEPGLYVSPSVRFIHFNPDIKIYSNE